MQSDADISEHFAEAQQQEQEADHTHHDDKVADTGAYFQPAAIVSHKEEKMLQKTIKSQYQDVCESDRNLYRMVGRYMNMQSSTSCEHV